MGKLKCLYPSCANQLCHKKEDCILRERKPNLVRESKHIAILGFALMAFLLIIGSLILNLLA